MEIHDSELLARMRQVGKCALCGKARPTVGHHIYTKGMGGGGQIDHEYNVIPLCFYCHADVHTGRIPRSRVLAVVAARNGVTVDALLETIREIRYARSFAGPRNNGTDSDNKRYELPAPVPGESPVHRGASLEADQAQGWDRY